MKVTKTGDRFLAELADVDADIRIEPDETRPELLRLEAEIGSMTFRFHLTREHARFIAGALTKAADDGLGGSDTCTPETDGAR